MGDFTNIDFFFFFVLFEKWSRLPRVPGKMETWDLHHRKERRKSLGFTSGIIHLMDLGQRYLGSKGVQAYRQEDGGLGSLASPGDREESASHNFEHAMFEFYRMSNVHWNPVHLSQCMKNHIGIHAAENKAIEFSTFITLEKSYVWCDTFDVLG